MSFAHPILLLGLVLVPLAALAYLALQARGRRESAAWSNPNLTPAMVTGSPGFRRHLPALLLLGALAALVLALAKPQHSVKAPQRAANVVMVTDVSGSMDATDVSPDRLSAAVKAAKTLTDKLPSQFRVGLISFSDYAAQLVSPTTDHTQIKSALDQLQAGGGTAMGDGLQRGLLSARTPVPNADGTGTRRLPSVIVLLSDGANTSGTLDPLQVARQARLAHVPVYTIALGTPTGQVQQRDPYGTIQSVQVPPDTQTLRQIAQLSGGKAFTATEASKLQQIYAGLGTQLSSKTSQREITAVFAGIAVLLIVAAGALSLRWFGRLL